MSADSLIRKYRPKRLADVVGQGNVIRQLSEFTGAPYSTAFLFSGPTGVGKSSVAEALATELGARDVASLWRIESGQQTADDLEPLFRDLRFCPFGSGFRVVIVEECDAMLKTKARDSWLSILDAVPTRTVFVFTTNHADKLEPRFLDRTEHYTFASDAKTLRADADSLIARVWAGESMPANPPTLADLNTGIGLGIITEGKISFRRIVAALESRVRSHHAETEQVEAAAFALKAERPLPKRNTMLLEWAARKAQLASATR